jgi:L-ascorbate metabolism protein UlaG (beta-lactamase superfamily)
MSWHCFSLALAAVALAFSSAAEERFERDILPTSAGDLEVTFIGHGSLMFTFQASIFHIDPFGRLADYSKLPKADVILLTHEHADHLDPTALASVRTDSTMVVLTETCTKEVAGGVVMRNGDTLTVQGVSIEAVPAYNIVHKRANGQPYHPKGVGNGYIIAFADKRVYVAGDTENTPEMKALRNIDCAFLPMNVPYTMTPEMVAEAAVAFQPRILYPYHFGDTDTSKLLELLRDHETIDVRIRNMQ